MTGDPLPSLGLLERWSLDLKLAGSQSCLLLPVFWSGRTVHNWSLWPVWASTPLHGLSFLEILEIGSQQTKEGRGRPGSRVPGGGAVSNPSPYTGRRMWSDRGETSPSSMGVILKGGDRHQHSTAHLGFRGNCVQWRACRKRSLDHRGQELHAKEPLHQALQGWRGGS